MTTLGPTGQTQEIAELHERLGEVTSGLGAIELRALIVIAKRIKLGQERYGELRIGDPRDWRAEAFAETLDFVVYGGYEAAYEQLAKQAEGGES